HRIVNEVIIAVVRRSALEEKSRLQGACRAEMREDRVVYPQSVVASREIIDPVDVRPAKCRVEDELVLAEPAGKKVAAQTAINPVVAGAGLDSVLAVAAENAARDAAVRAVVDVVTPV